MNKLYNQEKFPEFWVQAFQGLGGGLPQHDDWP